MLETYKKPSLKERIKKTKEKIHDFMEKQKTRAEEWEQKYEKGLKERDEKSLRELHRLEKELKIQRRKENIRNIRRKVTPTIFGGGDIFGFSEKESSLGKNFLGGDFFSSSEPRKKHKKHKKKHKKSKKITLHIG